ncbi:MAG: 50S ribosomal protein L18 [Desulfonauticus sp.]|nr:50S ribosomal protein L18 [Desulfonauticus sp.]
MKKTRREARFKRKIRIRKKIKGTAERPRLVVFRSNRYIYAQVVDDVEGKVLFSYSSLAMDRAKLTKEVAREVGLKVAEMAKSRQITKVVFDRNGYLYHGRVKALADGAREGGLKF